MCNIRSPGLAKFHISFGGFPRSSPVMFPPRPWYFNRAPCILPGPPGVLPGASDVVPGPHVFYPGDRRSTRWPGIANFLFSIRRFFTRSPGKSDISPALSNFLFLMSGFSPSVLPVGPGVLPGACAPFIFDAGLAFLAFSREFRPGPR